MKRYAFLSAVLCALLLCACAIGTSGVSAPESFSSAVVSVSVEDISVPDISIAPDKSEASDKPASSPAAQSAQTESSQPMCTLSISCAVLLNNMDKLDPDKAELIPQDGWLLAPVTVPFAEGESVFDLLLRVCREQKLHMEFTDTPVYGSAYIEGIGNLYEFDAGALSGWRYSVNGWYPNYGCSRYPLTDGDAVEWVYALSPEGDAP